jgi:2-polyprenyl-3-methyl-5-hydroxy-6-metoxy-1,4-benzoquinol methylase
LYLGSVSDKNLACSEATSVAEHPPGPKEYCCMLALLRSLLKRNLSLCRELRIAWGGERVAPFRRNFTFYAHLSIYRFALPFCRGKSVLDAGSGTGYGAAFLAERGCRQVCAVELDSVAVAFSRALFSQPNLEYRVGDVQELKEFRQSSFDVIFSSNVVEHLPRATAFFRRACEVLMPTGMLIMAVPPVTCKASQVQDLLNPYHVNSWSPRHWHTVLSQYFQEIDCYRHGSRAPQPANDASSGPYSEEDFFFEAVDLDELYQGATHTALFVARGPRAPSSLPAPETPMWFFDHSLTRPPSCWRVVRSFWGRAKRRALRALAGRPCA